MLTDPTIPPQCGMAETNLLGCVLCDPSITDELFTLVSPGDFYFDRNQRVYMVMQSLASTGLRIDGAAVWQRLIDMRQTKDVGDAYMVDLATAVPTANNWLMYAEKVVALSKRRQLIGAATEMIRDAQDGKSPADGLLTDAAQAIARIAASGRTDSIVELRKVLQDCLTEIDDRAMGKTTIIRTGYSSLDLMIGGFQPEKLYVIAARPGVGKTSAAVNFGLSAVDAVPVLIFSQEMGKTELGFRVLSIRSSVNLANLMGTTSASISPGDAVRVSQAAGMETNHGFYIDDRSSLTASEIARTVRLAKRRYGVKLVMIDYLQRMSHDNGKDTEASQIEATAKALKTLSKDEKIPVVCLAQLNRQSESRSDTEPKLSDIRGSGGTEQEADCVMLLHPLDKDNQAEQQLKIIIAKQRAGPMGDVVLNYVRPFTRLEDRFPSK